jgi:hypothetical protein
VTSSWLFIFEKWNKPESGSISRSVPKCHGSATVVKTETKYFGMAIRKTLFSKTYVLVANI